MDTKLLRRKLDALDLDGDAALSFSKRLARDNGWTHPFALRVVEEYKRFLFLAATCGHPVTPSDEVDQAWHLHLVYTRSYWDELCGEILGFPLHHGPTKGGWAEGDKFENWYERTLDSYRAAFGHEPPRDVWPPLSVRFGEASSFRRVNLRRAWVVHKPLGGAVPLGSKMRLAPVLLLLFLAGCAEAQSIGPNVFDWHGEAFLQFFWTLSAGALALAWWARERLLLPHDAALPAQPLDAYEVARLRDGKMLAVDVALASLWEKGALETTKKGIRATGRVDAPLHPFERALWQRLSGGNEVPASSARRGLEGELGAIDQKLRGLGLLVSREVERRADNWMLGTTFGLLGVGAIKIVVGLSRERPVGFLLLSCGVLLALLFHFLTNPARRSKSGDALLNQLRFERHVPEAQSFRLHLGPRYDADASAQARLSGDYDALSMSFALLGAGAFPPQMQSVLYPASTGGDAGGGGCGGGGGGGGCGGCGGGGH